MCIFSSYWNFNFIRSYHFVYHAFSYTEHIYETNQQLFSSLAVHSTSCLYNTPDNTWYDLQLISCNVPLWPLVLLEAGGAVLCLKYEVVLCFVYPQRWIYLDFASFYAFHFRCILRWSWSSEVCWKFHVIIYPKHRMGEHISVSLLIVFFLIFSVFELAEVVLCVEYGS